MAPTLRSASRPRDNPIQPQPKKVVPKAVSALSALHLSDFSKDDFVATADVEGAGRLEPVRFYSDATHGCRSVPLLEEPASLAFYFDMLHRDDAARILVRDVLVALHNQDSTVSDRVQRKLAILNSSR